MFIKIFGVPGYDLNTLDLRQAELRCRRLSFRYHVLDRPPRRPFPFGFGHKKPVAFTAVQRLNAVGRETSRGNGPGCFTHVTAYLSLRVAGLNPVIFSPFHRSPENQPPVMRGLDHSRKYFHGRRIDPDPFSFFAFNPVILAFNHQRSDTRVTRANRNLKFIPRLYHFSLFPDNALCVSAHRLQAVSRIIREFDQITVHALIRLRGKHKPVSGL